MEQLARVRELLLTGRLEALTVAGAEALGVKPSSVGVVFIIVKEHRRLEAAAQFASSGPALQEHSHQHA